MAIHPILFATDFSPESKPAFEVACWLAKGRGSPLLVLHVAQLPLTSVSGLEAVPPLPEEFDLNRLRPLLDGIKPADPSIACDHVLSAGDPVEEILRVAAERSCSFIVVGTHGRTGLSRLLLGSVAELVTRSAPCPVVSVRTLPPDD